MRFLQELTLLSLFLSPVLSQVQDPRDIIPRLYELGLTGFAASLSNDPTLLEKIRKKNDITVWAPGNDAVARRQARRKLAKRDDIGNEGQCSQLPPQPDEVGLADPLPDRKMKRQIGESSSNYPDTNFEKIYTFIDDPQYVNLGPGNQVVRFVKNYAAFDNGVETQSQVEVTSGLGNVQGTTRGPFKFLNGVIYEASDYFSFPESFTSTMEQLGIAQSFYNLVVKTGNLKLFEETPAITVFAPLDNYCNLPSYNNITNYSFDPESHILWANGALAQYFSPDLLPGTTLTTKSGDQIKITWAANGERLVNGRRLVKANVPTKNGVIHFIDGPLYGDQSCNGTTGPGPTPLPTQDENGATSTTSGVAGAFIAAFGAALIALF